MRVVALLGPRATDGVVKRFELPNVNVFSGNDMDPSDRPAAALVFGGDGTLHRHLPALIESRTPFLHVPLGSGNDFARSVGVRSQEDALIAWKRFVSSGMNVREMDAGTITPLRPEAPTGSVGKDAWAREVEASEIDPANHLAVLGPKIMESQLHHMLEQQQHLDALPHYFCGVAGVGLDSETNRRANAMPDWLRRRGGYILGAAGALASFRPYRTTVEIPAPKWAPTNDGWISKYDEPALLVAIGNTPSYGGGMRLTTQARMDDGLLDVCFVQKIPRLTVLRFFRTVFSGMHVKMPQVAYMQTDRLRVRTEHPQTIYADGEPICKTPVEIAVLANALRVIVPKSAE